MAEAVLEFEGMIVWKRTQGGDEEIPEPQPGLDEVFDLSNQAVDEVKARLEAVLQKTRQRFRDSRRINWSHAKYRYELEIPQEMVEGKKKPEDYEFTSARKDFQRFHTKEIKLLVDELEVAEERLQDALSPFLCTLFHRFHERKDLWNSALQLLTELDCLSSLSIVSGQQVGVMSRPRFLAYEGAYRDSSLLDLRQMRHPCVSGVFVPNDTLVSSNDGQTVLLVTGPNMGGKSTLLRQTSIAVILA